MKPLDRSSDNTLKDHLMTLIILRQLKNLNLTLIYQPMKIFWMLVLIYNHLRGEINRHNSREFLQDIICEEIIWFPFQGIMIRTFRNQRYTE